MYYDKAQLFLKAEACPQKAVWSLLCNGNHRCLDNIVQFCNDTPYMFQITESWKQDLLESIKLWHYSLSLLHDRQTFK